AFEGIRVTRGRTGLPVLAEALGYLEGRVVERLDAGDHRLYLVEITGAGAGPALRELPPMVHVRKNGFRY
ncbi:MAG: flavin reductase, partial [Planctomycetaceae bacterium]